MVERCGETLGLLHNEGISDIDTKKLRARLLYYFMNPCEKFQANRRLPWKLSVQLLKIVLFTVQVSREKVYFYQSCLFWLCNFFSLSCLVTLVLIT